jgi:hypothetical protein
MDAAADEMFRSRTVIGFHQMRLTQYPGSRDR